MSRSAVQVVPDGKLVFGMQLPVTAQSRHFVQDWEHDAGTDEILRIARACDRHGFFYLAVSDHVAVPRGAAEAMSTVWYDTIATLGYLAAATERVRLLSYVWVLPYRHPLVSAKAFATLDALSNGRVIIGVGAGHLEGEFDLLGVPFAGRGKRLDEAIDLLALALEEEYPTFSGETWQVRDMGQRPRPVQTPRPPIWVGGSTPAALRRAAERGDGWLPQGVPEMGMEAAIAFLQEHRARTRGAAPIEIGMNSPFLYVGTPPVEMPAGTLSGDPGAMATQLRQRRRLGVSHMGIRFRTRSCNELLDQIEAFGTEVAPQLND
jgi:probable F420-dependent oxidoreductase